MRYRIEDGFDVSTDRYWDMFFDETYNTALFEHLGIDRELIELTRTGEGLDRSIHRRQRLTPRREIPAVLQKFARGAVSYVEDNRLILASNAMEVVTTPSFLADKFTSRGTYRLESRSGTIVRVWEAECTCHVPFVGGMIEHFVVDEVQASYRATTQFTRRWLAEHV